MKNASLKTDRRKTAGTFVFPDEALRAARQKPFEIDLEALRREGVLVPFEIDLEALRREGVTVLIASDLKKAR